LYTLVKEDISTSPAHNLAEFSFRETLIFTHKGSLIRDVNPEELGKKGNSNWHLLEDLRENERS